MPRPSLATAFKGSAVALAAATVINLLLLTLAGDALRLDDMGARPIAVSTLVMIIPATLALWRFPRQFTIIVFAVAVIASPYAILEFGTIAGLWLTAMHLITATAAAVIAPRVASTKKAELAGANA